MGRRGSGSASRGVWLPARAAHAPSYRPPRSYNFPAITGVDINPLHLIQAIEAIGVPTFRGMKFTVRAPQSATAAASPGY